ncbi:YD repeat-containing protein [Ralstonia pickettii]
MTDSGNGPVPQRRPAHRPLLSALTAAVMLTSVPAVAGSVSYTYDALGRLATAVYNNGSTTTTITYSYDAAGNRTSVVTTSP